MKTRDLVRFTFLLLAFRILSLITSSLFGWNHDDSGDLVLACTIVVLMALREKPEERNQ